MNITMISGSSVEVDDTPLGSGSMGIVYGVRDGTQVVKLFKKPSPQLAEFMGRVIDAYNCTRDPIDARGRYWNTLYVWPTELVEKPSLGLLMPRFPEGFLNLKWLFAPKNNASLPAESRKWNRRVLITWRLAQAVQRFRMYGLAHSDLSHNNVLANPKTGEVRIIDIDGLVAAEFNQPQVLGTPRYIAPEVMAGTAAPSVATDLHALAVLIYQLLLFKHPLLGPFEYGMDPFEPDEIEAKQLGREGIYIEHPTDTRNRPKNLPFSARMLGGQLAKLFERAFIDGLRDPAKRPTPLEWRIALGRLTDRLITCSNPNCDERYYPVVRHTSTGCPWCNTQLSVPGGLPILCLYERGARKTFVPVEEFWIAGYPDRTLHTWHAQTGGDADNFADQRAIARITRNARGEWGLLCTGAAPLARMGRDGSVVHEVGPGESVPLTEGTIIRLGAEGSRFALTQWLK